MDQGFGFLDLGFWQVCLSVIMFAQGLVASIADY